MSMISRAVAHLFGGVSQQPVAARDPSYLALGDNVYPHVTEGLVKRYPTEHIDKLDAALTDTDYLVHFINRSATERYAVVFTGAGIKVYDLADGTEQTVSVPDGVSYITSSDQRAELRVVTVSDTTFVVNVTQTPALTSARSGMPVAGVAVSSITRASQTATVTTGVAHTLTTGWWVLMSGATQTEYNGWFQITVTGASTFTYTVTGSPATPATGSPTYTAYKSTTEGKKQKFSDLPTSGLDNGEVWEIVGNGDSDEFDSYYVKWVSADTVWEETLKPGSQYELDAATMPHVLTHDGGTNWTFQQATWASRSVGSTTTAPDPSFVGSPIRDVFFARDRLGFLTGASFVMSRAGSPYNFWRRTVTGSPDDDPIDREVTHAQALSLNWAVPFNRAIMLCSDAGQHVLTSDGVFSNNTVRADLATQIAASPNVRPVGLGPDLIFPADRDGFSGIMEYFVDKDSVTNDADDVTLHVPRYIPANLHTLTACSAEDVVVALSSDEDHRLYVYKRHWRDNERLQTAWVRFTFDSGDSIVGCGFIGSTLYMMVVRTDGLHLEKMRFETGVIDIVTDYPDTGDGLRVHLDRKVALTGVYDAGDDETTWTLPYSDAGTFQAILGDEWTGRKGEKLSTTHPTGTTIVAVGDYSADPVWIGRVYTKTARLSEIVMRDRAGLPRTGGRLQLRRLWVILGKTGYLRAEVTPARRDTYTYRYTGKVVGTESAILGRAAVGDARFLVPVLTSANLATVDLINDTYLPSSILGYEWEGQYTSRSAGR